MSVNFKQIIPSTQHQADYNRVQILTNEGKISKAWMLYVKTANKERTPALLMWDDNMEGPLNCWPILPPEALITQKIGLLDNIPLSIPVDFIRDCALSYSVFRQSCFREDKLWSCFKAYPESIADICKQHPAFAFQVVTSPRGATISDDEYRFEIFNAAYPQIIDSIQNGTMTDNRLRCLGTYLLCYRLVSSPEDFNKIKEIAKTIKEIDPDNLRHQALMNFVIGKYSLQGIYNPGQNLLQSFQDEGLSDIFTLSHSSKSETCITQMMINLELDEDVQKAVNFLYLIPQNSSNYARGRMVLGQLWRDQKEFIEAGKCFLEAANGVEESRECFFLAATCLLVKNSAEKIFSREKAKLDGIATTSLSPQECSNLVADKKKFMVFLKSEYADDPDFLKRC